MKRRAGLTALGQAHKPPERAFHVDEQAATKDVRLRQWTATAERSDFAASAHPAVEVTLVEQGLATYVVGDATLEVSAGQVVVIPGWVEHQTRIQGPFLGRAAWIDLGWMGELAESLRAGEAKRLLPGVLPGAFRIGALSQWISQEIAAPRAGSSLAIQTYTEALALEVLRVAPAEEGGAYAKDPRIASVLEWIEHHLCEPLDLDVLAKSAGMSRFHFSRVFRAHTGHSPYHYLLDRRLGRVAELLRSGRFDVSQAAYSVGFNDLGRFGQMFKTRFGQTPSEYRRAYAPASFAYAKARTA